MIKLSRNFNLNEFLNLKKYPYNEIPTQCLVNLQYGVATILQPLRDALGCPIIINSGYRCPQVNKLVGGVANSQHMAGCAADIRPADLKKFAACIEFLKKSPCTDQLLCASSWCHVSWQPHGIPRHDVRLNYYK